MDVDELISRHPRLFHMAAAGAWPAIGAHGLLSTHTIVTSSGLPVDEQRRILGRSRTQPISVEHPVLGPVVIRDQGPLRLHILERRLTDMTVEQWLDVLNGRVFLWPSARRLETLLAARRYRDAEHDVLTVDTESLVRAHADDVRLCAINSGATLFPNATPRGSHTFRRIEEHPSGARFPIAEFAVLGGVPDISRHVVEVHRRRGGSVGGT